MNNRMGASTSTDRIRAAADRVSAAGGHGRRAAAAAAVVALLVTLGFAAGRPRARAAAPARQAGIVLKKIKATAASGKPAAKGASANVGQEITLTGSGFEEPLHVEFFGFAGSAFVVNPARVTDGKRITVVVPESATSGDVRAVSSATGRSEPQRLQVVPVVRAVPTTPVAPGSRILIDGTGFTYGCLVSFAGVSAPVTPAIASPTRLDVAVPAGARSGKLTVVTPGGRSKPVKITIASSASAPARAGGRRP